MRHRFRLVIAVCTFLFASSGLAGGGLASADTELDKASRAAHGDGSRSSGAGSRSRSRSSTSTSASASASGNDLKESSDAVHTILTVVGLPWSVPYYLIEDNGDETHELSFHPYPYARGARGYFKPKGPVLVATAEDPSALGAQLPPPSKEVAGQLRLDGSHLLSNAARANALARLLLPYRFELDTSWSLFADFDSNRTRYAGLGSEHVAIRFAQTERVVFRTGLGGRHWIDRRGAEHGGDLLYGVDVFWGKPMTTTLEGQIGWVGSAFVGEVRGTIGVTIGRMELLLGYDHVGMSGGGISAALGGPILGVRAFL